LCELGIYGVYLCDSRAPSDQSIDTDATTTMKGDQSSAPSSDARSSPYINKYAGFLLRVKPAESDEGGVAAGYAVLSSPDLIGG
jgi:Eukaryotic glutathione synthase, ATP binding domain